MGIYAKQPLGMFAWHRRAPILALPGEYSRAAGESRVMFARCVRLALGGNFRDGSGRRVM